MKPDDLRRLARAAPSGLALLATRGRWTRPAHLALLERKLLEIASGKLRRLIVCMPPRSGKSETVSRFFPAWFLGNHPDRRVILASYEATFAETWGRKARDVLAEHGPSVFGVRVRQDSSAASRWDLQGRAGGMVTAGVGGAITGRGADLLVVDDPVKGAEDAGSETLRKRVVEWFRSVAFTRLEPGGACVIVMTRWHEQDLAGVLLAESAQGGEPWELVSLPAVAEDEDALGRKPGEALWPERYPTDELEKIKATVGGYVWAALYQQRPAPLGGGIFKRAWLEHRYDQPAPDTFVLGGGPPVAFESLETFAAVDLAVSTKTTADYTACIVFGRVPDGRLLVLDVLHERLEGPDIVPKLQALTESWDCSVVWIERAGIGLGIVQEARRAGLPVRELVADRDKVSRAIAATPALEGGRVFLPRSAPWLELLEHELLGFPNARRDDLCDAFVYGVTAATVRRVSMLPLFR